MTAVDHDQLADLYDDLVAGGDEVLFFVRLVRAAGGPVLELMAGTGRVSSPIVSAGVDPPWRPVPRGSLSSRTWGRGPGAAPAAGGDRPRPG